MCEDTTTLTGHSAISPKADVTRAKVAVMIQGYLKTQDLCKL